jgi:DNA/RNA-binding domain of Phe-tRNA-synthetase-like protein
MKGDRVSMLAFTVTSDWKTAHPGGAIGLLQVSGVDNFQPSPVLEAEKRRLEASLRQQYQGFTRRELLALPVMAAYHAYYRRFDKTYHVLLQLESITLKGRSLPHVSPAVDANFMAEVESLVLTAGHDAEKLELPVRIDISRPGETMMTMGSGVKPIRAGDMVMRDAHGICCSILYGQDARSPISAATSHVLYVTYSPHGVGADSVLEHLSAVEANIRLFSPGAVVEQKGVIEAG